VVWTNWALTATNDGEKREDAEERIVASCVL